MLSEDCISAGDGITAGDNGGTVGPSTEDRAEGPIAEVHIRDENEFHRKRQRIVEGGTKQLQVMADFDRTMTKFWVNGRMGYSCHMVIAESGLFSEEYHKTTTELQKHYYPMEVDPNLSHDKKVEGMVEWVTKAHEAMVEACLTKSMIATAVSKANLELRSGHDELFRWLEKEGVPFLVFSAGIADVLEEIFRQRAEAPIPSTMHVISNRMKFDEEGNMIGFQGRTLHVFNKFAYPDEPYFQSDEVKSRKNIVLLGDSLGDLGMAKGVEANEILTIGFLNDRVKERMEDFKKAYDVVIIGDGGFDLALKIFDEISATKASS